MYRLGACAEAESKSLLLNNPTWSSSRPKPMHIGSFVAGTTNHLNPSITAGRTYSRLESSGEQHSTKNYTTTTLHFHIVKEWIKGKIAKESNRLTETVPRKTKRTRKRDTRVVVQQGCRERIVDHEGRSQREEPKAKNGSRTRTSSESDLVVAQVLAEEILNDVRRSQVGASQLGILDINVLNAKARFQANFPLNIVGATP